jgi:hypothetical protein
MSKGTNLFDEINKRATETRDDDIDAKWQQRTGQERVKKDIDEIRSDIGVEEESLRKNQRERLFHNRRLQQSLKIDTISSLKDKLTISLELYEQCQHLKPEVKNKFLT